MGGWDNADPRILGRYVAYGPVASGGMATVYYGRLVGPAGFSKAVAIKRLREQFARDPDFVAMLLDEARLAAHVVHPNVVPTLDIVTTDSEISLVMEFVRGLSLARLLQVARDQGGHIPAPIVASIMIGVLHGLDAAHEAKNERGEPLGIVHRDVSPQNILVGIDGVARLIDFGVAKAAGRIQTTREGHVKGKLSYMAPEQFAGHAATRQSDVYGASVVLWESLLGRRLFVADSEAALLGMVMGGQVEKPSELDDRLHARWDVAVMKGLATDPHDRFHTAMDLAEAIESCEPPASPREVAQWLKTMAQGELDVLEARLARLESAGEAAHKALFTPAPSAVAPVVVGDKSLEPQVAPPDEKPRGRKYTWAAGLGIAVALVLVPLLTRARPAVYATSTPRVLAQAPAPIASEPSRVPPAQDAEGTSPRPTAVATATRHGGPPRPKPQTPRSKAHCDPPFTTDQHGDVHFKPECL